MPRVSDSVALANALRGQKVGEALAPFVGPENPPVNAVLQGLSYMTGPENPPVHALMQGLEKVQPVMDLMQLGAMPMMVLGPKGSGLVRGKSLPITTKSEPQYLYHTTYGRNLPGIQEQGLIPAKNSSFAASGKPLGGTDALFFADEAGAKEWGSYFQSDPLVLRADPRKFDFTNLGLDPHAPSSGKGLSFKVNSQGLGPQHLDAWNGEKWVGLDEISAPPGERGFPWGKHHSDRNGAWYEPFPVSNEKRLAKALRSAPANEPIRELMHWERGPIKYWRPEETEMVPVSELQKLMEYERAGVGANVDSLDNIKALEDHIKAYGLENPLMIQYWKPDRKAIIGEGNHRLAAALRAGIEELPARVYGNDFPVGKRSTMEGRRRMPVDVRGHLPGEYGKGELRPSEIGISSRPMTPEEAALNGRKLDTIGYPEGYRTFHEQLDDEDWKIIRDLKERSANRKLTKWKEEEGKLDPETKKLLDLLGW